MRHNSQLVRFALTIVSKCINAVPPPCANQAYNWMTCLETFWLILVCWLSWLLHPKNFRPTHLQMSQPILPPPQLIHKCLLCLQIAIGGVWSPLWTIGRLFKQMTINSRDSDSLPEPGLWLQSVDELYIDSLIAEENARKSIYTLHSAEDEKQQKEIEKQKQLLIDDLVGRDLWSMSLIYQTFIHISASILCIEPLVWPIQSEQCFHWMSERLTQSVIID